MAKSARICHDRVLPREVLRPQSVVTPPGNVRRAVIEFQKRWPNGSTLHVRFMEGTAAQKALVKEQARWWTPYANLKFAFDDASDAEIRIMFDPSDGAWSWVGTDCREIPQSDPTMNLGFLDGGTAAHEFGHAIGLGHEHQNPKGGIEWNEKVVLKSLSGPPNNWTPAQIRHNVLDKYAENQIRGTEFDPESIMLYFFPGSWTKSGKGTKANEVLSATDKKFIGTTEGYPRTAAKPKRIAVDGAAVTASIGSPGEEDVFTFRAKSPGRYVVSTSGKTNVVMKLFGPDSSTRLVAQDDDSGVGANARIIADLMAGEYFAQVRHYRKATGKGEYKVRVQKQKK
jgi:hypothetical protein